MVSNIKSIGQGSSLIICPSRSTIARQYQVTEERRKCTMPGKVRSEPLSLGIAAIRKILPLTVSPGQSQFLTNPMPAQPLSFNLSLDEPSYDDDNATNRIEDSDTRLMEMLAAQAALREGETAAGDEESIVEDKKLPDEEKRTTLQRSLHMAASNGDVDRVNRLLHGKAKGFIDVNAADEEGRAPIIYASCFVRPDFGGWSSFQEILTPCRVTMTLLWRCWKQELMSTGKIEISGLH